MALPLASAAAAALPVFSSISASTPQEFQTAPDWSRLLLPSIARRISRLALSISPLLLNAIARLFLTRLSFATSPVFIYISAAFIKNVAAWANHFGLRHVQ